MENFKNTFILINKYILLANDYLHFNVLRFSIYDYLYFIFGRI